MPDIMCCLQFLRLKQYNHPGKVYPCIFIFLKVLLTSQFMLPTEVPYTPGVLLNTYFWWKPMTYDTVLAIDSHCKGFIPRSTCFITVSLCIGKCSTEKKRNANTYQPSIYQKDNPLAYSECTGSMDTSSLCAWSLPSRTPNVNVCLMISASL